MADTGWIAPGTAAGDRGGYPGNAWTLVDLIKEDDLSYADNNSDGNESDGLAATNFDFSSIPSGSTIDGIECRLTDYFWSGAGSAHDVKSAHVIMGDDTDSATDRGQDFLDPTGSLQTDEAGGASELWGESPQYSDTQDIDFGFYVTIYQTSSNGALSTRVNFMSMKVYYTEDPDPTITDVNGTESWTDGDTGLVITGTNFV